MKSRKFVVHISICSERYLIFFSFFFLSRYLSMRRNVWRSWIWRLSVSDRASEPECIWYRAWWPKITPDLELYFRSSLPPSHPSFQVMNKSSICEGSFRLRRNSSTLVDYPPCSGRPFGNPVSFFCKFNRQTYVRLIRVQLFRRVRAISEKANDTNVNIRVGTTRYGNGEAAAPVVVAVAALRPRNAKTVSPCSKRSIFCT